MPAIHREEDPLRLYQWFGVEVHSNRGSAQAVGDCPFCGKSGKFGCNTISGLWDCKSCGTHGNPITFLRQLWEVSDKATNKYDDYATDRRLLYPETLLLWNIARSIITDEWLVPGWTADGRLHQLYRRVHLKDSKGVWKWRLLPAPGLHPSGKAHGLVGAGDYDKDKQTVYLCEGFGDAIVLWELLRATKQTNDQYQHTASAANSLLVDSNVLAVPGANVFQQCWLPLFARKKVVLLSDNDHPRLVNGVRREGAGSVGTKKVVEMLLAADNKPESIQYLQWGKDGYDPQLLDGMDVKDILTGMDGAPATLEQRLDNLTALFAKLQPLPSKWKAKANIHRTSSSGNSSRNGTTDSNGAADDSILFCDSWGKLRDSWRLAMKWTDGLDLALSVMLSAVISTETQGEQLWIKIMGPPSSGKTTLCEALSVSKQYVYPKSTLRQVYSGFKAAGGSDEDFSIVPQLRGRTLVVKDGDTILKNPERGTILSQYRDLYDGVGRSQFNNGKSTNYEAVRFTFILCGTSALYQLDESDLGARFLNCVLMHGICPLFERAVNQRVVHRAFRNVKNVTNHKADTHHDTDMLAAKRLTGGYVHYLRENAEQLLSKVEVTDEQAEQVIQFGELVAMLRARPTDKQSEVVEREFSSRLVEQFARLTVCLAAVLGKQVVDDQVVRCVRQVALDTARGKTLEIVKALYQAGTDGCSSGSISVATNTPEDKLRHLLRFLKQIEVADSYVAKTTTGIGTRTKWLLTSRMEQLYRQVIDT